MDSFDKRTQITMAESMKASHLGQTFSNSLNDNNKEIGRTTTSTKVI